MRTETSPSRMAKQIRAMYPLFFAPQAICLLGSLYLCLLHAWIYVASLLFMAVILIPPMWMLFSQSKTICEKAIEDYSRHVNETGAGADS